MRILHTADLHLGKRLDRFDRLGEQAAVLDEICEIADREQVDVVLIAGDLFDAYNPPNEATELFYRALKRLSANAQRPVVAIAGNHDSPDRIEAPDPLARACGILFAGYPMSCIPTFSLDTGLTITRSDDGFVELQLPDPAQPPLRLLLTAYANEHRLRRALSPDDPAAALRETLAAHWQYLAETYCDSEGINLMVAHLFMIGEGQEAPEEPEDERPILVGGAGAVFTSMVPPQIQYVALGHLHRWQNMPGGPCPCVYSSSPLAYSFAEAGQRKFVTLIDAAPDKPISYQSLTLQSGYPLQRMTFESADEALAWLAENQDCYVELTLMADSFILSEDRKRILEAHPRVIGPIPRFREGAEAANERPLADPTRGREDLFREYFQHQKSIPPNENLMALFREITASDTADRSFDPIHSQK